VLIICGSVADAGFVKYVSVSVLVLVTVSTLETLFHSDIDLRWTIEVGVLVVPSCSVANICDIEYVSESF